MSDATHTELLAGLTCQVWPLTVQPAAGLVLLLHGLGGDERSMAVFRPAFPSHLLVVSPRAPFAALPSGNSWYAQTRDPAWPALEEFADSNARIAALVDALRERGHPAHPLLIVGFSQGAAAGAAFAFQHRPKLDGLAFLAGFVPHPSGPARVDQPLSGLPTFVASGALDTTVPPEKAMQAIELLSKAGASLTTCDAPIAHKVSAQCVRALRAWAGSLVDNVTKSSGRTRESLKVI